MTGSTQLFPTRIACGLACFCVAVCGSRGQEPSAPLIAGSAAWLEKVGADDPAAEGRGDATYGAEANPTGEPIGGGPGYSRIVRVEDADTVVRTAAELLQALGGETPAGRVIYVADDAVIDLTQHDEIVIPAGSVIASGRGRGGSHGALLFSYTVKSTRLFRTGGSGIRLTGLRLEGPYPGRERLTQRPTLIGVYHPDVEIDNCEIFAWSCAAVGVGSGAQEGAWVHHNYIHHNQRSGLGYGVSLGRTHVLIEGNLFDFCRHAIASSGTPNSGYTARYNVHLEHTISHVFDMHGARDFEKYMQIGLWHFDEAEGERTNDYSIYNGDHDGTLRGIPPEARVEGRIGRAIHFDGEDSCVDMGKQRQLSPRTGLTAAAWIRPETVDGARSVFSKGDTGPTGSGYSLRVVDGALEGALYTPEGERRVVRGGRVPVGTWSYAAMTWDGRTLVLYLDGVPVADTACEGRKISGNNLLIGRDSATATSFFRGTVDEVRLYNRALKAADIQRQVDGNGDIAGRLMLIHHNTFRPANYPALAVRGRPSVGCWVHRNRFYAAEGQEMVRQSNAHGNMHVADNLYVGQALRPAPDFSEAPAYGSWVFSQPGLNPVPDASGVREAARVTGEPTEDAWVATDDGSAVSLVQDTRWVEIPAAEAAAFPDRVAVGLRMRIDELREHQVLLDNGLFRVFHRGGWAGHKLYFLCRVREPDRGGRSSWQGYTGVATLRPVAAGEWFDLVGERDGDTMRIYLNGMMEDEEDCLLGLTPAVESRGDLVVGQGISGALGHVWIRSAARPDAGPAPRRAQPLLFAAERDGRREPGVIPAAGDGATSFRFQVVYRDPAGTPPAIGFPRVHILRDGIRYLNEAPVTMMAVDDTPFDEGRRYTYMMRLPRGRAYQHFFEAESADGRTYRTVAADGPEVTDGSFAPVLSWTSQRGYVRDGVEPEIGDVSTEFDFRILFSDLDGDDPLDGCPRVHVSKGGTPVEGSPFSMAPMTDSPTWQGRPYRVQLTLKPGEDYAYFFTAADSDGNEAPPTLTRRSPTVDAGADVAAPNIADIRAEPVGSQSATIRWHTDEPADAQVEFGSTPAYGESRHGAGSASAHAVPLDGLRPGTTYHYRAVSTDAAGNRAVSGDYTFRTADE